MGYKKLYIYKYSKGSKLLNIYPILHHDDNHFGTDESGFCLDDSNKDIFFPISKRPNDQSKNYHLAKYSLKDGKYVFQQILNDTLPPIYTKNNIMYNQSVPCFSYPYSVLPFSNIVYNVSTDEHYTIPFGDSIFVGMDDVMNPKSKAKYLPYAVWDIKAVNPDLLCLVYTIKHDKYEMYFNLKSGKIISNKYLKDLEVIPGISLSGEHLYYYERGKMAVIPIDNHLN
ncbi:MAG TPA: hypothetical protein VN721_01115 [Flavipsychrobacter sp.]|nr:hypothetical protein [Flavipsychrobacter sp.]